LRKPIFTRMSLFNFQRQRAEKEPKNEWLYYNGGLVVCQGSRDSLASHRIQTGNYLHVKFGKGEKDAEKVSFCPFQDLNLKSRYYL
jgi:hypothetical protein